GRIHATGTQVLVSRQALWLGLGPAALLARLDRAGDLFRAAGDRSDDLSARHGSHRLPHLYGRALRRADRDLLAQGRAAALAVGRRQAKLSYASRAISAPASSTLLRTENLA